MQTTMLSAPWRNVLLVTHIAAAVGVLGADLGLIVLGIAGLGGADPLTIYPAAHLVASSLIVPLAVITLATGLLLGLLTPWGLFQYWWVTIKLAVTLILTGAVLFVLVPRLRVLADAVTGPAAPTLSDTERLPLLAAPAIASTLLLLALALAVTKPGWRLRSPKQD